MKPPVYLEGEGALLPDGTFVPEANLRAAVEVINKLCNWINELPDETRLMLQVEAAFHETDGAA